MADTKRRNSIFDFILIFLIVYLGSQFLLKMFSPAAPPSGTQAGTMHLSVGNVTTGNNAIVSVQNNTDKEFVFAKRCPLPPVDVFFVGNGTESGGKLTDVTSDKTAVACQNPPSIAAGASAQVNLAAWKYSIFSKTGMYEVRLPYSGSGKIAGTQPTARFTLADPGTFTKIFRTFISKPFLNFLIFVASILPDHNLGIAIIVLTLAVKLILYIPTQHAMEGQKKMQMLQPKIDELKHLYPNDPRKQQEETMKLWKEHGVNPFQSCLPTLVQFPVLIGLFYVIRDQSVLALSHHLIYPAYQHLSWSFGTMFLGFDLLKPSLYVMPPLLVIFQFLQMKLAFTISANKNKKAKTVVDEKGKKAGGASSAMEMQQKIMLYVLPLMIGFFAFKFPAAVSIYWGVSTLFGIGQQMIVNREHLSVR